jgi:hypothetical protein
LLEAHREFDRKHRSGANFETFAFQRVQGRVQEAFAVLGGFPRAVYRAAKKSMETRSLAWFRRNARQVCDGGFRRRGMYRDTVASPTSKPSMSNSP